MTTSVPTAPPSSTLSPPSRPTLLRPKATGGKPPVDLSSLRVAVVHDWLTGLRGGEKVLEAILELVPAAEIFTLFHFPGSVGEAIERHSIHVSSLQPWARRVGDYRRLLPFLPSTVEKWDFRGFDLVISSSHCVAKGAITGDVPHVTYCHTPMRYIWDRFDDYFPPSHPVQRFAMSVLAPSLRRWDQQSSTRVDRFVANSEFVRRRIERFYDRQADVVHPFVDDAFLEGTLDGMRSLLPAGEGGRVERPDEGPRSEKGSPYDLVISALVPYKKIDLAIEAARLSGRYLRIVGSGPLLEELAISAPPNVELLGHVPSKSVRDLARGARCLIIPGVEDFGITALEAMASGTPVVALGEGGVLDTVIPGVTGVLFESATPGALLAACVEADGIRWDPEAIRFHAATFSKGRFQTAFAAILMEEITRE